jgi:hypothetical protein
MRKKRTNIPKNLTERLIKIIKNLYNLIAVGLRIPGIGPALLRIPGWEDTREVHVLLMMKGICDNKAIALITRFKHAHPILSCGRFPPVRKGTKHLFHSLHGGCDAVTR